MYEVANSLLQRKKHADQKNIRQHSVVEDLEEVLNEFKDKLKKIIIESDPGIIRGYESVFYKIDRITEIVSNYKDWTKITSQSVLNEEHYDLNQKIHKLSEFVSSYKKDFDRIESLYNDDGESEYYLKKDELLEELEIISSKSIISRYFSEEDRKINSENLPNAYQKIHILLFESFFKKLSEANIVSHIVSSFVIEDKFDNDDRIIRPIMMKPSKPKVEKQVKEKFNIFNDANLTEDYELGLRFYKLGFKTSFVNYKTGSDFGNSRIATAEYFPNTFKASVKQKSRWIAGIVFQNWKIHGWTGSLKTKYFLLRDRKTIFSFFGTALSYILLVYLVVHSAVTAIEGNPLSVIIQKDSILWYMMMVCLFFMFVNISHRFIFTYNWFGFRYAISSIYRIFFDNIVNVFATARAVKVFRQTKHKVVWDCTEHY
jgi:hypothetical protein